MLMRVSACGISAIRDTDGSLRICDSTAPHACAARPSRSTAAIAALEAFDMDCCKSERGEIADVVVVPFPVHNSRTVFILTSKSRLSLCLCMHVCMYVCMYVCMSGHHLPHTGSPVCNQHFIIGINASFGMGWPERSAVAPPL